MTLPSVKQLAVAAIVLALLTACTNPNVAGAHDEASGGPTTLEVCAKGCAYAQLRPALEAAGDGDTIRIGPGTYRGGVRVDASVNILGVGSDVTIIAGGGPAITIGTFDATTQPTVTLQGVTVTGGVSRSSGRSVKEIGAGGVIALGGGVEIPASKGETLGATVLIKDSVITKNRAIPSRTNPSPSGVTCPNGDCPFALGAGGGIDNWGTLTLVHSTVSDNVVGAVPGIADLASDAQGGGIMSWLGPLTIVDSVVDHNRARASAPNGRYAEGGGIFLANEGSLTIRDSDVTNNAARLDAALPASVDMAAQPGGIFVNEAVTTATIVRTHITGNSATMTNSVGNASAFAGGINVLPGVDFRMQASVIADNHVRAETIGRSKGDASGDSGGADLLGVIVGTRITGNVVEAVSRSGDATAAIGGLLHEGSLTTSTVSDNHLRASSPHGSVVVFGAGISLSEHPLTLRHTTVSHNTADADGRTGSARGGGIYDGPLPWGLPGSALVLLNSTVTRNALRGTLGITLEGGGIFLHGQRMRATESAISGNVPDQCFGCSSGGGAAG